jgi:hypothetical protein
MFRAAGIRSIGATSLRPRSMWRIIVAVNELAANQNCGASVRRRVFTLSARISHRLGWAALPQFAYPEGTLTCGQSRGPFRSAVLQRPLG